MAIDRDDQDERIARIDMLLEELRVKTEDLHDLAQRAEERAEAREKKARAGLRVAKAEHARAIRRKTS